MLITLIRTVIIYAFVVFGIRLMGKRQLGELQPSELVITILISNIATLPIEDSNVPLLGGILPILSLVCLDIMLSCVTLKFKSVRKLISGNPIILIKNGKLDQSQMRNLRFSIDDLLAQLRTNGIFDIRDVDFAIVETTGKLCVYQNFNARNVTAEMLNIQSKGNDKMPPVILISDGEIIDDSLKACNLKSEWLFKTLKQNGLVPQDVYIMTCDRKADYYIIPKEKKK